MHAPGGRDEPVRKLTKDQQHQASRGLSTLAPRRREGRLWFLGMTRPHIPPWITRGRDGRQRTMKDMLFA